MAPRTNFVIITGHHHPASPSHIISTMGMAKCIVTSPSAAAAAPSPSLLSPPLSPSLVDNKDAHSITSCGHTISRRRVRFADRSTDAIIPSSQSRAAHGSASTWYSAQELAKIRHEDAELIRRYRHGHRTDPSKDCFRGLEARILPKVQKRIRAQLKQLSISVVLDEQRRQWSDAEWNPERLSRMSINTTRQCQAIAFRMGRLDSREARKCA
eukprot:CAMPEP_0198116248 /NCGR_PEP_ID=MMETSP1442-20131203/10635_1 /TAXON_ID= /ORGANISM="Craspedostauros australis, Strain CCMP3328" /LENGTH=211 /DNA_ID=CAMNT_0043774019 /DNA_START=98 /DNA_END=733 /DNA_ORIENTATION=-